MAREIAIGTQSFEELREKNAFYVDKTAFIKEWWNGLDSVTLITRPRRFGKTLNMSMMESFFDVGRDSKAFFEGLDIAKHEEFCSEWMNQYPVLSISLKDVDGLDFESAYDKLKMVLADYCKKITRLGEDKRTDNDDRAIFARLKAQTATGAEMQNAFKTIMRMMNAVYGKPVILLIDEYDVPLAKARDYGFYPQMLNVIRGLLSTSLKTNDYLKFAVITGCLRIAKESIFTGVNNFKSYSVVDEDFSRYFGFTEEEVNDLLVAAEEESYADTIREWYDGYIFGNTPVYCPWDVVNFVADARGKNHFKPKNYWKNSSGNGIIREFAEDERFQVGDQFESLLNGGTITKTVSDELTYETLKLTEDNLWSVLVMTGYLTKANTELSGDTVALKIPNREISVIFEETVMRLFAETVDTEKVRSLTEALWNGNEQIATEIISDLLLARECHRCSG